MGNTTVIIKSFADTLIKVPVVVSESEAGGLDYTLDFGFGGASASSVGDNNFYINVKQFDDTVIIVPGEGEGVEDGIYDFSYDETYE